MNITYKKRQDLIPYDRNAKLHDDTQINNVAESIKQFGFVQPIVIDRDNVIVIGHCRALAAERLGLDDVPCVCVDELTPDQANALRIVDNKTNESPWDFMKLEADVDGLDFDNFDFGFITDTEVPPFGDGFEHKEEGKEPKKIQCPHCGEWFEV